MAKSAKLPTRKPAALVIPETTEFKNLSDGRRAIRWGRDAWLLIAEGLQPRLSEVKADMPPSAFARMVFDAQVAMLPEGLHRTFDSLVVGCSPSSNRNVQALTMQALLQFELDAMAALAATVKKTRKPRSIAEPTLTVVAPPPVPAAPPVAIEPAPVAPVAQTPPQVKQPDPMAAFLAMPVGQLMPIVSVLIRKGFADAVAEVMSPLVTRLGARLDRLDARLDAIPPDVQRAIEDALGAPTPAPTPPIPDTPETVAEKVQTAVAVRELLEDSLAPVKVEEPIAPAPAIPKDTPHDMATQLELAAKALGMDNVKRPSIIVCGLHPKVFQELEHTHGRRFKFQYIKQDHFNTASDLPASTDGLILSRKKLNSELMGCVRRYAIPWKSIANSMPAVEWALNEMFPAE